jgi:hypothetical protein
MYISEQEKKDILNQYENQETSDAVLIHLRRNFPLKSTEGYYLGKHYYIVVGDKMKPFINSKKGLTNGIFWEIKGNFPGMDESILRRTIRKYLTGLKTSID